MSFAREPDWGVAADAEGLAAGVAAVRPSFGEYLGAQVREGFWASTTGQFSAQARMRSGGENEQPLTAEEWRQSPHFRQSIPFDERITPTRARALAETFDANAYRRWLIDQRQAGILEGTAGFAAGIVGSIPDPINFIPFAGPAFRAAQVARFGTIGGRAIVGAAEAAIGTAAAQPFLVTSRRQFGDDVTLADAMMDIALSAFAGAAIGGAAGVWTRMTTRATPPARNAEPELEIGPRAPEAIARDPIPDGPRQEAAMRVLSNAMRDMAEGRAIAIDPRWAGEFDGTQLSRARVQLDDLLATTAVGRTLDTAPDIRLGAEPDPRAIFREVAPELAARREEIETRRETQRRWLDELRVSGEARIREEFDAKIAALETRRESIDSAKRRAPLTKQIAALTAERDAAVARLASSDSPDMARVRQALLDDELKLRDMAPEISAAMREAERKAIARTPRIQSRVALVDAIERRRRLDFSTGADPDAALRAIETAETARAYDRVRAAPAGAADDPLVRITPEAIEATALSRGGWKGLGDIEVEGSGLGLVKIIWRHGEESRKPKAEQVTREDVLALPDVVRDLAPQSGGKPENRMWVRERADGQHVVYLDGPTAEGRRVLSVFVAKNRNEYPVSKPLGEDSGSPGRLRRPAGDTAQETLGRPPGSREGTIAPDAGKINPGASPERRDLIVDTDALLADLEADPRHAEAAKAARAELARASGFDDAAGAAARCLKG
jgi:hypothetical protein